MKMSVYLDIRVVRKGDNNNREDQANVESKIPVISFPKHIMGSGISDTTACFWKTRSVKIIHRPSHESEKIIASPDEAEAHKKLERYFRALEDCEIVEELGKGRRPNDLELS